jgi:hypothetical protein
MTDKPKKLRFEDLQPHVDMLCDALENRGASPTGISYNEAVFPFANKYRELLAGIREKKIGYTDMIIYLHNWHFDCMKATGNNQRYRIFKLLVALEFFVKKEFTKIYN